MSLPGPSESAADRSGRSPPANPSPSPASPVIRVAGARLRYGRHTALAGIDLTVQAGEQVAVIGPDGVGKSSLLALIAGARRLQKGDVEVLGGSMRSARHRHRICQRIAYLPQGLGRNLYDSLSVRENIDFFARLFGGKAADRGERIDALTEATGLAAFRERAAAHLSGGMRQKLGLCCALVHEPDLLLLDEPTTGIDPLSRRQFWELIADLRAARPRLALLLATSYLSEAREFDAILALQEGRTLARGTPQDLLQRTDRTSLEQAFLALLEDREGAPARGADQAGANGDPVDNAQPSHSRPSRSADPLPSPDRGDRDKPIALEADHLTLRFGNFTAVDSARFRVHQGEIFGFVGSNGSGKTTTMKMLAGLLTPSEGRAFLFGQPVDPRRLGDRRRIGYLAQTFSLYRKLTVRQNLRLHGRLYRIPPADLGSRMQEAAGRFGLEEVLDRLPDELPLGLQQRLSLAVAVIHRPDVLILDEPTSGVDPLAREDFWQQLQELSRRDGVTIFLSTHLMPEAQRCDRVALMHEGRVLATDTPAALCDQQDEEDLEETFVAFLRAESEGNHGDRALAGRTLHQPPSAPVPSSPPPAADTAPAGLFRLHRALAYARRETLELCRDPVRLTLAFLGSLLLMFVMGHGISLDVEDLDFAVLDRDDTAASRDYAESLAGSRYFHAQAPLRGYADLDERLRRGELSLAVEIPPGFGRALARGEPVAIGAWLDGSMPSRAETARGYVQGLHQSWLARRARAAGLEPEAVLPARIETRFRYNPQLESLVAMVPAMIPLLLLMIPAMLASLSVVREKELGSIVNFYVTPTRRLEFLLGKQAPYLILSFLSFLLLVLFAVGGFQVPLKGSLLLLSGAALLYLAAATALGMFLSSFLRSQIAAIFGTAVLTILPAVNFSGLLNPVSSLQGFGRVVGELYPTTHFLLLVRGTFSKALGPADLQASLWPLAASVPVLVLLAALALRKQEK